MPESYALVVFSHLRWDFVFQRPQHLLSRLAQRHRILFIEEPIHQPDTEPHWQRTSPVANVTVARLHTPEPAPAFHDAHVATIDALVPALLRDEGIDSYVLWLYTAQALPHAQALAAAHAPQAVVYDCMDELSAFLHAPRELLDREAALLAWADLVFTGGPSLYEAKRHRHPHAYCFPSSVDAAHFRGAQAAIPEAEDQAALPHPRLGFYGVIDERFDVPLLAELAAAHPEWQIVLVGPVVKIDQDDLPRSPNIHYMGMRSYDHLPSYLAGWNVCLLPFALNDATRFISPTKTLEYMAAERPIVSTPITDVVQPYGEIVYIGAGPQGFIAMCEQALAATADERERRFVAMRHVLAQTSWERTVQSMETLIDKVVAARIA
ncbi:MAG: glycosyltransferase [Chloroflexales bacterium]|nr:glycosyltransferase [Chloroflexales bacterium]